MTTSKRYEEAALCLKALAHPTRLAIVGFLLQKEKASVGLIAKYCKKQSHIISEHLQKMKARGFVSCKREGRTILYSIREKGLKQIMLCVETKFGGKS